jgi:osmotically-inducible protein OsmY
MENRMPKLPACLAALSAALLLALPGGCALLGGSDAAHKVGENTRVPGLDEAVQAKDMALEAAILMTWKSDVELLQEQLAVEEVRAGKVRITGIVSRKELKERAEAMARDQDGVVDVLSTITVDETLKDKRLNLDEM